MDPLRIIAGPRRLQILELVWDQELSAGDIARHFDVTWGAVSQHITVLRQAGYLAERREGTTRYYRANKDALGTLRVVVEDYWRTSLTRLKMLAESEQSRPRSEKRAGG
jgi:DNA-binding transcriptional ArsR family regulator